MTIRSYQFIVQALVTPSSGTTYTRTETQSLGVSDEALRGPTEVISESLGVSDVLSPADIFPFDGKYVQQSLGVTDAATSAFHPYVVDSLGVTDAVVEQLIILNYVVSDTLGVSDEVDYGYLVKNEYLEDDLGITDQPNTTYPVSVSQSLGLSDETYFTSIDQDLGLTDLGEWGYGYDFNDNLVFIETIDLDKILNPSVPQDLGVGQAVAWFVEDPCGRVEYQLFHGEGGVAPSTQGLHYSNTFLMQSIDDGTIVSLRNPETDDVRRTAFNRVNRSFFDGTADIYTDDGWVTEDSQIYTLTALKRSQVDEIQTFLLDNLGRQVVIKDWRGVSWISIITNTGDVFTEDREGYWTIGFEVVGDAVDGEYVIDIPSVSDLSERDGSIYTRSATEDSVVTDRIFRNDWLAEDTMTLTDSASNIVGTP